MSQAAENRYWERWHDEYDEPTSARSLRLAAVQRQLSAALDEAPAGEIRLLSMCAGDGRDVLGVLGEHPRAGDVRALLVERSPMLIARATETASRLSLPGVSALEGDAGNTDAYAAIVPAHVLLVCGVFGSITQDEIEATCAELPHLGTSGSVAIWTKQANPPDLREWVRDAFVAADLEEIAYERNDAAGFAVGSNRWNGPAQPFRPGRAIFEFRARAGGADT